MLLLQGVPNTFQRKVIIISVLLIKTQVWLPNSFAWDHTAYQRWNSTQAFCIPGLYLNAYPLQMEEKDEWLWIEIFFSVSWGDMGFETCKAALLSASS